MTLISIQKGPKIQQNLESLKIQKGLRTAKCEIQVFFPYLTTLIIKSHT